MKQSLGKFLYGALFLFVVPSLLVLWTAQTGRLVNLPAIHSAPLGVSFAALGLALILAGMHALWKIGGGLPMNAFPPPNYVSRGVYRFISHPIYVGFVFICAGTSIMAGSSSGLWLTTPVVAMASVALVLGYELEDMRKRFGNFLTHTRLPFSSDLPASMWPDRVRCVFTIFLPWLILYEGVVHLGSPRNALIAYLPLDYRLPVLPWTEVFYISVYPVVVLVPFLMSDRAALRLFCMRAIVSMALVFPIFLCLPMVSPPRPFVAGTIWGQLLNFERRFDSAAAAFPSYHAIWAFLAAEALGRNSRTRMFFSRSWALLVSISCITTGMHALIDVASGLLTAWMVIHAETVWAGMRHATEFIANSWREWRLGPIRVINHGAFAGAGVFIGVILIESCLGSRKAVIPVAIFLGGTVGAALWAQVIEGSPALLRPLGFYGGLLGTSLGAILAALWTHTNPWLVLAALCVAGPWIQGIGRLRCLVQGCCHGRPTSDAAGIRYWRPQSRVCKVPGLRNTPIYPTPLYSLLWNGLVAMAVARLYLLPTSASLVGGIYLILSGLGRFVEEAYRGEPQTPILWGLRLYQWAAIATVIAGALISSIGGTAVPPQPRFYYSSVWLALLCAAGGWFVTGVDFPESNKRFARLT
jgi:prolipoprotein diacylglyceryltransferase/protein-S-isoprenylcysteine O-methyltransferase Ste14